MSFEPSYMKLFYSGELERRKNYLYSKLKSCNLCPRNCNVNRYEKQGFCGNDSKIKISEYVLYPGEEPPLTGNTGAGGIFFSGCSMKCMYCQNSNFSQKGFGKIISVEKLKNIMLELQNEKKAKNLDLITATPFLPQIFDALILAIKDGFRLPIVWNTSSYETAEIANILDDVVDIYLADLRYTSNAVAKNLSLTKNYCENAKNFLKLIYDQIGENFILENDILKRGIIFRILVIPEYTNQAKQALKFIKYDLSENLYISLMDQYVPAYNAKNHPKIGRFLFKDEYLDVVSYMTNLNLTNGWVQNHTLKERLGDDNVSL